MRLICPNCDAQYEVDASAIPAAGRDVQCSNCGHAWFQAPDPTPMPPDLDGDDDSPEPVPQPPAPRPPMQPRRTIDENVLAVLREEAEREAIARRADAATLEMQGDLGLAAPPPRPRPVAPAAPVAGIETPKPVSPPAAAPPVPMPPAQRPIPRRDLLPDIEEINSTLGPSATPAQKPYDPDDLPDLTGGAGPERSGFRSGFVLMLIAAGVGTAVYVMAPSIAQQIPGAADALTAYVAAVDAARVWLDGMIRQATGVLNSFTGNGGA